MAFISTILDTGLAIMTNLLTGLGDSPKYVAWGTGTTEAAPTDTGLETPAAEARTSGTATQETTTTTDDTYKVVGLITCTGTAKAITEVAIYDADALGNGFMHANFAVINVDVGDSINFTISNQLFQY